MRSDFQFHGLTSSPLTAAAVKQLVLQVFVELRGIQPGIIAVQPHQFAMRSLFYYLTLFHDQNQIGVDDRREPVRDDEARPAFHQVFDGILDHLFRFRVDRSGRLVEHEDPRIRQHGAGKRNQLLLSRRQP